MHILIVEDSPLSQRMYKREFPRGEHVLHMAQNGETALAVLEGLVRCDVIVLDLQMPGMNGVEFMRRLRRRPEFRPLPVVVVTAEATDSELVRDAWALQVAAVVTKPWKSKQLLSLVESIVTTSEEPRQ